MIENARVPNARGGDRRQIVEERCLLAEDLFLIQQREPANWRRFAATAEYSFVHSDPDAPFAVVRHRDERVGGQDLVFCLLAFPTLDARVEVLFGELAMTARLFQELVKPLGVLGGLRRGAVTDFSVDGSPSDHDGM